MNLSDLKKQIVEKNLDSVYYFTGDEWKIMNVYIHKFAEITNGNIVYADSIRDIINEIKQTTLLANKTVYVINNDKEYMLNEKLWSKVAELNRNILVFVFSTIDKRSKFYKQFKDSIATFDKLNDITLARYISNVTTLKNEYVAMLIDICEHDYGRILLELDKINHFSNDSNYAFETLIKNDVIYIPPKDAVFDLVDAILNRNAKLSYKLYDECRRIGEANLVILLNLFNSTRITYQIQTFKGNGDICQITGLKQGQVYACQKRLHKFLDAELEDIMRLVQRIESGIKQGTIADEISIDYLLANLFSTERRTL